MSITSLGVGSGLDLESLVNDLVNAEIVPQSQQLDQKQAELTTELSAVGTLKATLDNFNTVLSDFEEVNSFLARKASSGDTELFTVDVDETAVASSYQVEVERLAEAQRLKSAVFADADTQVGTGTLTFTIGEDTVDEEGNPVAAPTFDVVLAEDEEGNAPTLAQLRDAINEAPDNPGVTATIVNGVDGAFLFINADDTGTARQLTITASADSSGLDGLTFDPNDIPGSGLSQEQEALDASVVIDGVAITSSSNTVTGAIDGVTIELLKAEDDVVNSLEVEINKQAVQSRVDSFIFGYNSVIDTINSLTLFDADSGTAGPLLGDSTTRVLETQLRSILGNPLEGATGSFDTLSDIGVTLDFETGRLVRDQEVSGFEGIDTVEEAIEEDLQSLAELFAGENGIAVQLQTLVAGYVENEGEDKGSLNARIDGLNESLEEINEEREELIDRANELEAQLRAEFIALDLLVAELNSTSAFLTEQLSSLSTPS